MAKSRVYLCLCLFLFLSLLLFSQPPSLKTLLRGHNERASKANLCHSDPLCDSYLMLQDEDAVPSTCSARATSRRPDEKVVSYSFFGSRGNGARARAAYEALVPKVSKNVKEQYPGWVVRIYTDYKPEIPEQLEWMQGIQGNLSHVDFCFVDRLPVLGNNTGLQNQGRMWRFLAGMDPLVDIFLSRDTDALVIDRERDAAREWLDSGYMIHAMRDHPWHSIEILAGLWGAKTYMDRELMANLTRKMVFESRLKHRKQFDQDVLRTVLWPATKHNMMVHDSYFCTKASYQGPKYRPFPTRREERYFAAYGPRYQPRLENVGKCPKACRPPDHQDWDFC